MMRIRCAGTLRGSMGTLHGLAPPNDGASSREQLKTADEAKNLVTEAVAKLRRCLELKPSEHKAMWCLGQCHHALGFMTEDREEAEELFAVRSLQRKAPRFPIARRRVQLRSHRVALPTQTMTQEFRRAVELEPGNPVYQHSVEQARQTLDMWEQIHEQLQHQQRLQDVGEIRPARGAGRKATSSKVGSNASACHVQRRFVGPAGRARPALPCVSMYLHQARRQRPQEEIFLAAERLLGHLGGHVGGGHRLGGHGRFGSGPHLHAQPRSAPAPSAQGLMPHPKGRSEWPALHAKFAASLPVCACDELSRACSGLN